LTFEELLDSRQEFIVETDSSEETEELRACYQAMRPEDCFYAGHWADMRFGGGGFAGWGPPGSYINDGPFALVPHYAWSELRAADVPEDEEPISGLLSLLE